MRDGVKSKAWICYLSGLIFTYLFFQTAKLRKDSRQREGGWVTGAVGLGALTARPVGRPPSRSGSADSFRSKVATYRPQSPAGFGTEASAHPCAGVGAGRGELGSRWPAGVGPTAGGCAPYRGP